MEKKDIETFLEYCYNECLNCEYNQECKKRQKQLTKLETSLQNLKNENIKKIREMIGIISLG